MSNFNAKKVKDDMVKWIQDWFEQNGKGCNAVVGISGGLDSSVVSALCVEALGKDRVIAVKMPDGYQQDEDVADILISHLDIKSYRVDIHDAKTDLFYQMIMENGITPSEQTKINIAPRVRMTSLYAISQSVNGRVMNTSNLSESYVGYDTRFGDSVGDISPLFNLTKTEIRLIGKELGLPEELVNKTPIDGLCGQTDEDRFGFTYDVLDKYIRTGICENEVIKNKIDTMHEKNLFKLQPMPSFQL